MYIANQIIEDARREFLDECDFVLRLPSAIVLKGHDKKILFREVICIPKYFYIGIKENHGYFDIEEKCIRSNLNTGSDYELKESDWETLEGRYLLSLKSFYITIFEDHPVIALLKFKKTTFQRLFQCKLKIWSDIPKKSYLFYPDITSLSIILYLFENTISFEDFNVHKEQYKNILKNEKMNIMNITPSVRQKLNETENYSYNFFTDILMLPFYFNLGFNERAAAFYSLLGEPLSDVEQSYKASPEMMRFELPSTGETRLDEDFTSPLSLIIPSTDYATPEEFIGYINKAINNKKMIIRFYKNILSDDSIAVVNLDIKLEDFFEPVLSKFFPKNLLSFELSTKKYVKKPVCFSDLNYTESNSIKISYSSPHLLLRGPLSDLRNITNSIIKFNKGTVQYIDSPIDGKGSGGAKFLTEEEYKLC